MWLKKFLESQGYKLSRATQEAINKKQISKAEYGYLMGKTLDQLRIHEEVLIHGGAFHAAEYISKAIDELLLIQDSIESYDEREKEIEQDAKSSHTNTSGTSGTNILRFNEKGSS